MSIIKVDYGKIAGSNPQWCAWSTAYWNNGCMDVIATNCDIKYASWSQQRIVENDYFILSCTNGLPTASVTITVKKTCTVLKETWDVAAQSAAQSYTPTTETINLTQGQTYIFSKISNYFLIRLTVQE